MRFTRAIRDLALLFFLVLLGACRAAGCAAATFGDIVGETGDSHCDRRFVTGNNERADFCQEIIDTVAQSDFEKDCRDKHGASAGEGRCPRERVIAGCKLDKVNDDGSEVWDWYYDVSDLEDAGDGGDGGGFENPVHTKAEVRALCNDRTRYDEGATYQDP